MIELWRPDDPAHRVRCQTRSAKSGGQCLRFQDHGGDHAYGPRGREDEADVALHRTTDEGLLRTFAALTHRLHVADRKSGPEAAVHALDLREERDRVQAEILRRMR